MMLFDELRYQRRETFSIRHETQVFEVSNVFEMFNQIHGDEHVVDISRFNGRLPFPSTFLEARLPRTKIFGDWVKRGSPTTVGIQIGDSDPKEYPEEYRLPEHSDERVRAIRWMRIFGRGGNATTGAISSFFAGVDGEGHQIGMGQAAPGLCWPQSIDEVRADSGDYLSCWTHAIVDPVLFTLHALQSRNVHHVQETPTGSEARRAVKHGKPLTKYYTLRLDLNRPMRTRESMSSSEARDLPLHFVRGHFRTYTEEKKLFGQHAGTFFIPAHERGSVEFGRIHKTYEVVHG